MLRKLTSTFMLFVVLTFGAVQLIAVPNLQAAVSSCFECCPATFGGGVLVDCQGPFTTPYGELVGCSYAGGLGQGPSVLFFCGQEEPI